MADPSERPGLRELKKRETRRRLHGAAVDLVLERGLERVTVDEIAAAAQVSTRTFFNYFPTKESSIVGADPEDPDRAAAALLARPPDEPLLDALEAVLVEATRALAADPDLRRRRVRVFERHPELLSTVAGSAGGNHRTLVGAAAQRLGVSPEEDPTPVLAVSAALGAVRAALRAPGDDVEATMRACFRRLRDGL